MIDDLVDRGLGRRRKTKWRRDDGEDQSEVWTEQSWRVHRFDSQTPLARFFVYRRRVKPAMQPSGTGDLQLAVVFSPLPGFALHDPGESTGVQLHRDQPEQGTRAAQIESQELAAVPAR
jgi:hypothetical protein